MLFLLNFTEVKEIFIRIYFSKLKKILQSNGLFVVEGTHALMKCDLHLFIYFAWETV